MRCIDSCVYPVISQQSVFSTLTTLADLCVMASVLLHGLPLLPPGRARFKSLGYLPESHPAVIGRGGEIKAKGGGCSIKSKPKEMRKQASKDEGQMRDWRRKREKGEEVES